MIRAGEILKRQSGDDLVGAPPSAAAIEAHRHLVRKISARDAGFLPVGGAS